MLTQKMTKEKLLIIKGKSKNSIKLKKTIKLFDTSLMALLKGNKELSVVKSSNKKIITQLNVVVKIWNRLKPLYEKENLNTKELALIINENPILLKEMNKMVKLAEVEVEY
jgi:methyl-accepting chemotaxis protein